MDVNPTDRRPFVPNGAGNRAHQSLRYSSSSSDWDADSSAGEEVSTVWVPAVENGRSSPRLAGRVRSILEDENTANGEIGGNLSIWYNAERQAFLESQGWERDELDRLSALHYEKQMAFFPTLFQQAASRQDHAVLNSIPCDIINAIEINLIDRQIKLTALSSYIQSEGPSFSSRFCFLTEEEREENRNRYFSEPALELNEELREWLSEERGWENERINALEGSEGEALISKIIEKAIEIEDYTVLLSLPLQNDSMLVDEIEKALAAIAQRLSFIDSRDELLDEADAVDFIFHRVL